MKTYELTIMDGGEERKVLVENTDMSRQDAMIFAAQREGVSISCVLGIEEVKESIGENK